MDYINNPTQELKFENFKKIGLDVIMAAGLFNTKQHELIITESKTSPGYVVLIPGLKETSLPLGALFN